MPSLITLRRKIRSIGNTKQITRAMQMVAASKMRKAQDAVLGTRAYASTGYEIMTRLERAISGEHAIHHPLLVTRPVQAIALIVITSDRGLAGAYNANVIRKASEFLTLNKDKKIDIITIGRKGQEALVRAGFLISASFIDFASRPTSTDLRPIAKLTIEAYIGKQYDQITVIYTKFYSTLRQVAEVEQILPVMREVGENYGNKTTNYLFEPKPQQVLEYVVPRLVEMRILQTVLESNASEHSSRMIAMKNATDNATELMGDLRLTYNSLRQAGITQEIAEISAGAQN